MSLLIHCLLYLRAADGPRQPVHILLLALLSMRVLGKRLCLLLQVLDVVMSMIVSVLLPIGLDLDACGSLVSASPPDEQTGHMHGTHTTDSLSLANSDVQWPFPCACLASWSRL